MDEMNDMLLLNNWNFFFRLASELQILNLRLSLLYSLWDSIFKKAFCDSQCRRGNIGKVFKTRVVLKAV